MGISDHHIHEIKSVSKCSEFCPTCGKKVLFIEGEIGGFDDGSVHYCPDCDIYFDFDDGYFTDDETTGTEKLEEAIKKMN